MISLGSKLAPPQGSQVWKIGTKTKNFEFFLSETRRCKALTFCMWHLLSSDEFNYRCNQTRTTGVICLWLGKFFRIVLSLEYNFVISSLIDLKLGICVCCNNAECSVKEPILYLILSMSYFPLIVFFTAFSACLEYNFVIYSLNIFKFDMYDYWKFMECTRTITLPSTNIELFLLWPSFL